MEPGQDRYSQHVEVSFAGLDGAQGSAAAPTSRRSLLARLWSRLAVLPAMFTTLRKLTLDLGATALILVVVGYFVAALNQREIIIEAPSVPKALQDRGLTPELLTHLIQARVQEIHAAAQQGTSTMTAVATPALPPSVPVELIQAQIDGIYQSFGVPLPSDPGDGVNEQVAVTNEAFAPRDPETGGLSLADRVIAATDESIGMVTEQINRALETTSIVEMAVQPSAPLVIATAGLNLSVDSLAHAARRLLGIGSPRRLTVSILCRSAACGDDTLTLHVVATAGDTVVAEGTPLIAGDLERAVAVAADTVMEIYAPQVLAGYYYGQSDLAAARRVAALIIERQPDQAAWAEGLLGVIALREADISAAGRHLESALDLGPEDVGARVNLGVVYFRAGAFEAAKDNFSRALAADPDHAVARINLGNTLLRLCDWEGAARAYEQVLAVDPQSAPAQFSLDLVKSIPALKTYLLDRAGQRKVVVSSGNASRKPAWRGLDELAAAATFCSDLAQKTF